MNWLNSIGGCLESVSATIADSCRQLMPELVTEEVVLGARRFRIIRQLAEGGYSFVYLVRETTPGHDAAAPSSDYALKKVQAASQEQLAAARFEIAVMSRLRHPNLLPLLASHVGPAPEGSGGGGARHVAYMLFPLYSGGSLADLVERVHAEGRSLPASDIINIFIQVARALQAMHSMQPEPLIHRDVKPHNVLLQPRSPGGGQSRRRGRYAAVLMDFGSVQEGRRSVASRSAALALQEEAEAHCTAPYRPPELWDVASDAVVDERLDTWSLGCLLYFMMYGVSPFERVLNEAGGSLMLAVINNALSWPPRDPHPAELRQLVSFCLVSDPATRPFVDDVIRHAVSPASG